MYEYMKSQILLSLDHDVIYRLRQEGNMSGYVNNLLSEKLGGGNTKETIEKAITEQTLIIEKAQDKLKKLKERQVKIPKFISRHV